MGAELALAMDQRETRWESRALWSQWYDDGIAAGLAPFHASMYATRRDLELREVEETIYAARRRLVELVKMGENVAPQAARQ